MAATMAATPAHGAAVGGGTGVAKSPPGSLELTSGGGGRWRQMAAAMEAEAGAEGGGWGDSIGSDTGCTSPSPTSSSPRWRRRVDTDGIDLEAAEVAAIREFARAARAAVSSRARLAGVGAAAHTHGRRAPPPRADSEGRLSQHPRAPTPTFGSGEAHEPTPAPTGAGPLPPELLARVPAAAALSAREEAAASLQRRQRAWFFSAARAAASLTTAVSECERAARAAARVRLLDVLGPVYGQTPDTVGTAHLARPLRWHRVARQHADSGAGPGSHPVTHAAQEFVSQRYVWHWRTNLRFGPPRDQPPRKPRTRTPPPAPRAAAPPPPRRARSASPPPRRPPSPPVVILSDFCALALPPHPPRSPVIVTPPRPGGAVHVTPPSSTGPPPTGVGKDTSDSSDVTHTGWEGKPGGIVWSEAKAGGAPWPVAYDGAARPDSGADDASDTAADTSGDDDDASFWGTASPASSVDAAVSVPSARAPAPPPALGSTAPGAARRPSACSAGSGGAGESKWAATPPPVSPRSTASDHLPPEARTWAAGEVRYLKAVAAVRVDRRRTAEQNALANATRRRAVRDVALAAHPASAHDAAARRARGEAEVAGRRNRRRRRRSLDGLLEALRHSTATLARLRQSAAGVLAAADALQATPLTHGDTMPAAPAVALLPPVASGAGASRRPATPPRVDAVSAFFAPGRRPTSWLAAQREEEAAAAAAARRAAVSDSGSVRWYASQLHRAYTPTRAAYLASILDLEAYDAGVRVRRWAGGARQRARTPGAPMPGRAPEPVLSEAFTTSLPPQPPTTTPGGGGGGGGGVDMARSRGRATVRSLRRLRPASADGTGTGAGAVEEVPFTAPPPPDGAPGPGAYGGVGAAFDALRRHVAGVDMALAVGRPGDGDGEDDSGGGPALVLSPDIGVLRPRTPAANFGAAAERWDDDDGGGSGGGAGRGLDLHPEAAAAYLRDGRYRAAPNFGAAVGRDDAADDDGDAGDGPQLLLAPGAARDRVGPRGARRLAVDMARTTGRGDDDDDDDGGGGGAVEGPVLALHPDAAAVLYPAARAPDFGRACERGAAGSSGDDGAEGLARVLVEGERRLRASAGSDDGAGFFIAPEVLDILAHAAAAPAAAAAHAARGRSVPAMRYMAGREDVGSHYALADVAAHAYFRDIASDTAADVLRALAGRW